MGASVLRYFFSTGEAVGRIDRGAARARDATPIAQAQFEGIGGERMRGGGLHALARSHRLGEHGTARGDSAYSASCLPPCGAPRCISLREKPDLIVLVDFGAFNLRLAKTLRRG